MPLSEQKRPPAFVLAPENLAGAAVSAIGTASIRCCAWGHVGAFAPKPTDVRISKSRYGIIRRNPFIPVKLIRNRARCYRMGRTVWWRQRHPWIFRWEHSQRMRSSQRTFPRLGRLLFHCLMYRIKLVSRNETASAPGQTPDLILQ
jgi:hypothetical protein